MKELTDLIKPIVEKNQKEGDEAMRLLRYAWDAGYFVMQGNSKSDLIRDIKKLMDK